MNSLSLHYFSSFVTISLSQNKFYLQLKQKLLNSWTADSHSPSAASTSVQTSSIWNWTLVPTGFLQGKALRYVYIMLNRYNNTFIMQFQ